MKPSIEMVRDEKVPKGCLLLSVVVVASRLLGALSP